MRAKFLSNFLFLLFINVLVKPVYVFGIDLKVQDTVGAADYGLYFILFNYSLLFYILLDLGLIQYNSRVIAQDHGLLSAYLPNFVIAKAVLGLSYMAVVFAGAWLLGLEGREWLWLAGLAVIHLLNSLTEYLRSNIAALHLFRLDALLSVVGRGLLIVVCGIWLYGGYADDFSIGDFIQAQVGAQVAAATLSLAAVLRYTRFKEFSIHKKLIVRIIKEGYPYALLVLLTTLYTRTDAVMLKLLLPLTGNVEAGYYAAAYRFLDMATMFGVLMASQLLPMFARLLKQGDDEGVRYLVMTGFKLIMFVSVGLSVCVAMHGSDIIAALYSPEKFPPEYVGWILALLIFSFIPIGSSYVFNTLMNANASLRILNIVGLGGLLLNILLNILLIPQYEALGAVVATLFTQGIVAVAHLLFAARLLRLRLPAVLFVRILLFGMLIWLGIEFGIGHLPVHWLAQFGVAGLWTLVLGLLLGLLDKGMLDVRR